MYARSNPLSSMTPAAVSSREGGSLRVVADEVVERPKRRISSLPERGRSGSNMVMVPRAGTLSLQYWRKAVPGLLQV